MAPTNDDTQRLCYDLEALMHEGTFRPIALGIEALCLVGGVGSEGSTALLRYAPGARLPRHRHEGLEQIFVLAGSQSDELGTYEKGSLVLNPAGSVHSVTSRHGCVVLVTWHGRVVFE